MAFSGKVDEKKNTDTTSDHTQTSEEKYAKVGIKYNSYMLRPVLKQLTTLNPYVLHGTQFWQGCF